MESSQLTLTAIADIYGSDKGSQWFECHNYTEPYAFLFEQFRHENFTMLEIGLQRGAQSEAACREREGTEMPSIRMWLDYFSRAHVVGFDLSDFSHIHLDRFTFVAGDQSSAEDLGELAKLGPFRLIVDDGSHASYHQRNCLEHLFPMVEDGGFYVIEDLHWQPEVYENTLPFRPKVASVIDRRFGVGDHGQRAEDDLFANLGEQLANTFISRGRGHDGRLDAVKMVALQKRASGRV